VKGPNNQPFRPPERVYPNLILQPHFVMFGVLAGGVVVLAGGIVTSQHTHASRQHGYEVRLPY